MTKKVFKSRISCFLLLVLPAVWYAIVSSSDKYIKNYYNQMVEYPTYIYVYICLLFVLTIISLWAFGTFDDSTALARRIICLIWVAVGLFLLTMMIISFSVAPTSSMGIGLFFMLNRNALSLIIALVLTISLYSYTFAVSIKRKTNRQN